MQSNKEAFNEFARGFAFCIAVVGGGLMLFVGIFGTPDEAKSKPEDRFKVVDQYGPCEVVRYSPKNGGNYAYFLDCK
jgi:hypothetical protein